MKSTVNQGNLQIPKGVIVKFIVGFLITFTLNGLSFQVLTKEDIKQRAVLSKYDVVTIEVFDDESLLSIQKELTPNENGIKMYLYLKLINDNLKHNNSVKFLIHKDSKLNSIWQLILQNKSK